MQWGQAIHDYGEVIRLKPEDPSAWRQRGRAHLQLKAYDKAVDDFSELVKLQPDDAGAWQQRAQASTRLEDYDKAITDFNEAIRLDPKSFWGYVGRSEASPLEKWEISIRRSPTATKPSGSIPRNSWATRPGLKFICSWATTIRRSPTAAGDPPHPASPTDRALPAGLTLTAGRIWPRANREQAIADYNEAIRLDRRRSPPLRPSGRGISDT